MAWNGCTVVFACALLTSTAIATGALADPPHGRGGPAAPRAAPAPAAPPHMAAPPPHIAAPAAPHIAAPPAPHIAAPAPAPRAAAPHVAASPPPRAIAPHIAAPRVAPQSQRPPHPAGEAVAHSNHAWRALNRNVHGSPRDPSANESPHRAGAARRCSAGRQPPSGKDAPKMSPGRTRTPQRGECRGSRSAAATTPPSTTRASHVGLAGRLAPAISGRAPASRRGAACRSCAAGVRCRASNRAP